MLRNHLIFLLKVSLTLAILGYIFNNYIDIQVMSTLWREINYHLFIIMLLLHYIYRLLIAWQFKISLLPFKIVVSTYTVFKVHLISAFYAFVLPGDLAGGVTWYYLSRDNGRRAEVASVIVYLKGLNLFTLLPLALLGLYFEPKLWEYHVQLYILVFGILLLIPLLPFFWSRAATFIEFMMNYIIKLFPSAKWSKRFTEANNSLWSSVRICRDMPVNFNLGIIVLSFIIQLVMIFITHIMMVMVNIHIPISAYAWLIALMIIVHAIPLTIAGTGLRELTLVVVLKELYSVPPESSLLFSAVALLITLFFGAVWGGYYAMNFERRAK